MTLRIDSEADAIRLKDMLVALSDSPDYARRSLLLFAVVCDQAGHAQSANFLRAAVETDEQRDENESV